MDPASAATQPRPPGPPPQPPQPLEIGQEGPAVPYDEARPRGEEPALAPGEKPEVVDAVDADNPTGSHELADKSAAEKPVEEKGYAEIEHGDTEVKNLGWNSESPDMVASPLVGGLTNEDLWALIRRFDKQIFHVKSIPDPPLGGLDLNIADEEEFSPDKLRAHIERLYMHVIVGAFGFWKHIVRLRSWREPRRTSAFLAVYALGWALDLVVPTLLTFLVVLIVYPPSRAYCFPPAPPSVVDPSTGGVKKPASGVLASANSVTGAPEKHSGEAVEQEAHSFVSSISSLVVSTAAGKHPQGDPPSDPGPGASASAPDPADASMDLVDAKDKAAGEEPGTHHDKTKKPVSETIWIKARPGMRMMADFVDTYERFGNALSPTTPFPQNESRLKLAGVFVPLILASLILSPYTVWKANGFSTGFVFFGDPLIQRGLAFINRRFPHWQEYLELRNTVLKGVPTNAQLTITLLRMGERNKAPIPPPPASNAPPSIEEVDIKGKEETMQNLGADKGEVEEAVQPDHDALAPAESDTQPEKKQTKGRKIINFIKGTTKGSINTSLTANKVRAMAGSVHARERLGVVKGLRQQDPAKGPVRFPARYKGRSGHAYITATATTPALSWTAELEDVNPAWSVTIGDIEELQKVGGLGWKSKIVVGWATNREIADGLIIRDKMGGERHLTAILTRDQLFNRLVAIGSQMWEAW
ncbi:hypothetical protein SODALDRAFT_333903 [Sodiomyces alkalinus F11]|uniref:Peroxin domain-containing protein n=1 Tax=Sodiomyces alkalinus (strain CBS 110278 / VKM F-3762 / F11) TaxID=1314773 RepID=A0A3N2PUJ6_SODAK|nr:hypothetical protein SODALDRAFT_333903 [Sodiomyces alkalinus F11]ROT38134.1 hypothetical protein SODALDRAFT_333903 [Sodiomyces alkalinus F11]